MRRAAPPSPPPSPPGSDLPPDDEASVPPPEDEDDDIPPLPDDDEPPLSDDDLDAPPPNEAEFSDDDPPPIDDESQNDLDDPPIDDDDEPPLPEDEPSIDDIEDDDIPPSDDEMSAPQSLDDEEEISPPNAAKKLPNETNNAPGKNVKGGFVLPVKTTAGMQHAHDPEDDMDDDLGLHSGRVNNVDLTALTAGLAIKQPPQLLRNKANDINSNAKSSGSDRDTMEVTTNRPKFSTQNRESFIEEDDLSYPEDDPSVIEDAEEHSLPNKAEVPSGKTINHLAIVDQIRRDALSKGYLTVFGKYESDPFERMYAKVDRDEKILSILIETGEEICYNLSLKSYVFEDTVEPFTIVLDYHGSIIIFKFENNDTLIQFMKNMPEEVFMAPEVNEEEERIMKEKAAAAEKEKAKKEANSKRPQPKIDHVPGTSVEDILENDLDSENRQLQLDQMFQIKDSWRSSEDMLPAAPYRRKELVESYIRKPKYSVRRVTLLCEWINSMHIWPQAVTISTLHKHICNGVLLARIVKKLNPEVQFLHLNEKPLAKKAAVDNLDQALGHIWRSKSMNNSRIPSANDIYSGKTSKTAILLNEIFGVYTLKPLYKIAMKMLKWYNAILKQYSRPLPNYIFDEGDLSGVWLHFQSGTALFCVIYHFFGPSLVGKGQQAQRIDPLRVSGDPSSLCDYRDNVLYVFQLLEALQIDVLWKAEDWITFADTEFTLLQLFFIYEQFKNKQCSLPPAHGNSPGITSGPNGEPLVVGLVFADAPSNSRFLPKTRKAVLLGYSKDSMPLLPIEKAVGANARFAADGVMPLGMTSQASKIAQIAALELKESRINTDRSNWNARTTLRIEKDTFVGKELVDLLREQHKTHEMLHATAAHGIPGAHNDGGGATIVSNASSRGNLSYQNKRKSIFLGKSTATQSLLATKQDSVSNNHDENNNLQRRPDEINKEIEAMTKALEEEMQVAQLQVENSEEALVNKYLELEQLAPQISAQEYEARLDHLEQERAELEAEKQRLQDHFERKMAFIKARKQDIQERSLAAQQAAFAELAKKSIAAAATASASTAGTNQKQTSMSPNKSNDSFNISALNSTTNKKSTTKKKPAPQELKAAEKGWIGLSAKMSTHNFHLRSKQAMAVATFQAKVTPKHLLDKEKKLQQKGHVTAHSPKNTGNNNLQASQFHATNASPTSVRHKLIMDKSGHFSESEEEASRYYYYQQQQQNAERDTPMTMEEMVNASFSRFKHRLLAASQKWEQSKNKNRTTLMDMINAPMNIQGVQLIQLPEKSFASNEEQEQHQRAAMQHLRNFECSMMQYEDERRRLVIAEQSLEHAMLYSTSTSILQHNSNMPNGSISPIHSSSPTSYYKSQTQATAQNRVYFEDSVSHPNDNTAYASQSFSSPTSAMFQPSQVEIDAALKWLCTSRPLVINDRNPKEFVFSLVQFDPVKNISIPIKPPSKNQASEATFTRDYSSYAIEWREFSQFSSQEIVAGFVLLDDIESINGSSVDQQLFQITIAETTSALRNSKGRMQLLLKCGSQSDCMKYFNALTILLALRR